MTEQRRLAAILVADVVGYSKLVGSDETGTLAALQALRSRRHRARHRQARGPALQGSRRRLPGGVRQRRAGGEAARAIQQANAEGELSLRIGIHVGDVVVQGEDLMGDGVNIAARIEGVAEPSGIAISREVHAQVRDKLDLGFRGQGRDHTEEHATAGPCVVDRRLEARTSVIGTRRLPYPTSRRSPYCHSRT